MYSVLNCSRQCNTVVSYFMQVLYSIIPLFCIKSQDKIVSAELLLQFNIVNTVRKAKVRFWNPCRDASNGFTCTWTPHVQLEILRKFLGNFKYLQLPLYVIEWFGRLSQREDDIPVLSTGKFGGGLRGLSQLVFVRKMLIHLRTETQSTGQVSCKDRHLCT